MILIPAPTRLYTQKKTHKGSLSNAQAIHYAIDHLRYATPKDPPTIFKNEGKTITVVVHETRAEFFSYDTRIAVIDTIINGAYALFVSDTKYSSTTDRHLNTIRMSKRWPITTQIHCKTLETAVTVDEIKQHNLSSLREGFHRLMRARKRLYHTLEARMYLLHHLGYHPTLEDLCGKDERLFAQAVAEIMQDSPKGKSITNLLRTRL